MKFNFAFTLLIACIVGTFSCTSEVTENIQTKLPQTDQQLLLKETSVLLGEVLRKPEVTSEIISGLKMMEDNTVSFSFLFGETTGLKKDEEKLLKKSSNLRKTNSILRGAINDELKGRPEKYKLLRNLEAKFRSTSGIHRSIEEDLSMYLE